MTSQEEGDGRQLGAAEGQRLEKGEGRPRGGAPWVKQEVQFTSTGCY